MVVVFNRSVFPKTLGGCTEMCPSNEAETFISRLTSNRPLSW